MVTVLYRPILQRFARFGQAPRPIANFHQVLAMLGDVLRVLDVAALGQWPPVNARLSWMRDIQGITVR